MVGGKTGVTASVLHGDLYRDHCKQLRANPPRALGRQYRSQRIHPIEFPKAHLRESRDSGDGGGQVALITPAG